jgi:hypothetical protein
MRNLVIALLLTVAVNAPAPADERQRPLGAQEFTSIDGLASAIAAYFPRVQGEVKAVQGDRITIALGKKAGLAPGMALTLWREGKDILHPVTKAVIGRTEEEVGTVEVTAVGDGASTAVIKKKLKDPKPGDKARITPKKINLAVVPLRADKPEIITGLATRLAESGRFSVLESEKVAAFLQDKKVKDIALIKELGRAFDLDAAATVGIYPSDDKLLITTKIYYADDGRLLDTVIATLALSSNKEALGDLRPFFAPDKTTTDSTPGLPFDARFFVSADFDGDGAADYAFSDGARLSVYRLEPSGWKEIWTETGKGGLHLYLDAADINGNGRPEIFVTAMAEGKVSSSVVEFQDGTYRRVAEAPGFLRLVAYPGQGKLLIGQDFDGEAFFSGTPRRYTWSGGKYAAGEAFPLPQGVGLYGFSFADLGEPQPFLVALDAADHLLVYSRDTQVWKSQERYAGTDTVAAKPAIQGNKGGQAVRIKGTISVLDIDGDGKDEIIVPRNIKRKLLGGYKAAELHGLGWTGGKLEEKWGMKGISGSVLDIQGTKQDKGPAQVLALVKSKSWPFIKQNVRIMIFSGK